MTKIIVSILFLSSAIVALELGKIPSAVTISGKNGAKVDGSAWSSSMLKGKIHILFYVDPDKKELNMPLAKALKAKNYDKSMTGSLAIINLAATWIPNVILEHMLEEKQKQFPNTLYVKDKKKVLVNKWHLADDNSDILIFDKRGKLIYKKFGKMTKSEIKYVIKMIEKHL